MRVERPRRSLPAPGLAWDDGRTPRATRFGDVYYTRVNGLAEARHVFLGGNALPQAWQNRRTFCIGELGFGTGLTFLAAWRLWRRSRPDGAHLHYVAVEGFPLTRDELALTLEPWTELKEEAATLAAAYPAPQPGFLRVLLAPDVTLTLLFGEVAHMLGALEADIDAWFLDGFAPDKNPAMWSAEVFTHIARLSHAGTTLATYSVAGAVRRGLEDIGFEVTRAAGFGAKREMLRARARDLTRKRALAPWYARAPGRTTGQAAIVGAGLAGAHTAAALRRHGWTVTLFDRAATPAAEASGNPRAVVAPRLTAAPSHDGRFYAAAWRFALARMAAAGVSPQDGSLQLAHDAAEAARSAEIAAAGVLPDDFMAHVDAEAASQIAGLALPAGGLFFPQGGWLDPRALCAALTAEVDMRLKTDVASLTDLGGRWRLKGDHGADLGDFDIVVLANALGATRIAQTAWLPLTGRRGQASFVPATPVSSQLRTTLLYGGYLTPEADGMHALGATFDTVAADARAINDLRDADHMRNLMDLARVLPHFFTGVDLARVQGYAGVRCVAPDHLPCAGPAPAREAYVDDFAHLRHGHPWAQYPEAREQALYVLTALGSRGVVSAPLAAELLAAHVTGAPWPLERDLVAALHPARFLVRELKRRRV